MAGIADRRVKSPLVSRSHLRSVLLNNTLIFYEDIIHIHLSTLDIHSKPFTSSATAFPNNLPVLDSSTPLVLRPRSALRSTPLLIPPSTRLLLEVSPSFPPSSRGGHTDIIFIGALSTAPSPPELFVVVPILLRPRIHLPSLLPCLYFIFRSIHHHHRLFLLFRLFLLRLLSPLLCVSVLLLAVSKGELTAKSRTLASRGI